jgi:UDP-N-acetylmuramoyl-tripeptide--D-alanyl-D-alanine ligase
MFFNNEFLKKVIPSVEIFGSINKSPEIVVDSRLCKKGDIFVALKGNQLDGHDFILDAIANGADVILIDHDHVHLRRSLVSTEIAVVVVPDTHEALLVLAKAWRQRFDLQVIGITGSVGKTTTKEMVVEILKNSEAKFVYSAGNLNTMIGAALTIFKIRKEHQYAIMELGINQRGEMANLVDMVNPTIAAITFIAHSHVSGLGSLSDIAIEKRTIFKNFTEKSIGIVNGDQQLIGCVGYNHPVVKFGTKTTNQIQARKIKVDSKGVRFVLKLYKHKYDILIENGNHGSVNNACAAASIAKTLSIPDAVIISSLQKTSPITGRFEFKNLSNGRGTLIDDCYNANPESMKNAIHAFEAIKTSNKKIAILGDMNELGIDSPYWHRQVGRFLRKAPSVEHVVLVGKMINYAQETLPQANVVCYQTWQEALNYLQNETTPLLLLIKGSTYGYTKGLCELVQALTDANFNLKSSKSSKATL